MGAGFLFAFITFIKTFNLENSLSAITASQKPVTIDWISNLRVLALFAVIVLHAASPLLMNFKTAPLTDWFAADLYNALTRFAVPVFVMISGALQLRREYELGDFLKKRFTRVLWPFLIWSLVYVAYSWYDEELPFYGNIWRDTLTVLHQLRNGAYYHLWYVYMLVGLYLVIPVIGKFVRNATEVEIRYFLIVWFMVIAFSQPYLNDYWPLIDVKYFSGYIGYLVLGYYLANIDLSRTLPKTSMILFYLLCLISITVGTYLITNRTKEISTVLYEPLGPFVIFYASGVFLLARVIVFHLPERLVKLRDLLSNLSLGIYLCHALFLSRLDDWGLSSKLGNPFYSIPLTALVCLILSFMVIYMLSKIPVIGKYIAG